ncbi:MAG: hypothetical protein IKE90_03795 [Bacilli bacterium]|nr:hypothetical protein [Bacilli bacterium]
MKNVIKINKSKVKVLYLKNKNISLQDFITTGNDLNLYEITYYISLNDKLKEDLFSHYKRKVEEDEKKYKYGDLFILISLSVSLEKYDIIKELYDRIHNRDSKLIESLNFTLIEYYRYFSDYESILKFIYALSMCKKAKRYILKQTLNYLKYMTDVDDELIIKILKNIQSYDLFLAYKIYRAVTDNLDITLKEGIPKYFKMSYEEFEELAYMRADQHKYLILISELYKDKYNATIEDFYNNIDSVFEKIKKYNKELVTDNYKYIQKELFLFIILGDSSKYEKYKKELFDLLKSELFRPSYVYHDIDKITINAIKNGKIIEVLDNMPNNIYGYKEDIIDIKYHYRFCKHEYLKYNYKNIFDYLKKYTPDEIIRIYMNTSLKLVTNFDDIIKFIKENYNEKIDISNYYFYGNVRLNNMNKYELNITNISYSKTLDLSDNIIINNLYSYYLDNEFKIRFKFNSDLEISDIDYVSKDGTIISFYDRYKDVYNSALLGIIKDKQIDYIKNSKYYNLPLEVYKIHLNGILNIDETNYKEIKTVLENDSISGFNKSNYDIDINKLREELSYSKDLVIEKWNKILNMKIDSTIKFHIYINSAFKIFVKIEDVLKDLDEIKELKEITFVGNSSNNKLTITNFYSDKIINCNYNGKIIFHIKDSSFNILDTKKLEKKLEGLDLINFELKNSSFSDENILNIEDLLTHIDDERYTKHVNYLENLLNYYSNIKSKDELLLFIKKIGKNNIFNERYPIYYPIFSVISNLKFDLYEKVKEYNMSLDEGVYIYLNSPIKYMYMISDYLKDFFKKNKAACSLVDLSNHELIIECFILEKDESSIVEYNGKKYNLYIEDVQDYGFAKIKLTKYEVFTGKLYGQIVKDKIDKIDIKSEYEKAFNKMKNFKIGGEYNSFNYIQTYRASVFNVNDYIEEYQKIIFDNLRDIDFLYDFLKKNSSFNLFNSDNNYGELKYNTYIKQLKKTIDGIFRFGDYNESIIEKKIYVSENSFIKNPLKKLLRKYLKNMELDRYEFKNGKRVKLKINEINDLVIACDEYRNYYSLKFNIDYNLEKYNYIIVDLLEYDLEENYFKASLVSIFNEENDIARRFDLYINDILNIMTNLLYDNGKNFSYYLEKLSKYSNENIRDLKIYYKKDEFFYLYLKLFKKYINNFDALNKILICLGNLNPYDVSNANYKSVHPGKNVSSANYKSDYIDKEAFLKIANIYINVVNNTKYYLETLNIYYNSFICKYIPLQKLRDNIKINENEEFNKTRDTRTIFIKYKNDNVTYLKSYCNKLKFPIKEIYNIKPFMYFRIKKRRIKYNMIEVKYSRSYHDLEEISNYKS